MATPRSNSSGSKKKSSSTWRSVRMPHHGAVARTLQQRYSLRWHGLLIGSFTLLLMWATSHLQMVLGVVEPQASGLGGGGFLLHYNAAERRLLAYDGRETAPAGATSGLFLKPDGTPLAFPQAVVGGLSVGVPGLLRLLETAHRAHGRLHPRVLRGIVATARIHRAE